MTTNNETKTSIALKPGVLVALSTKVEGGVHYRSKDTDVTETANEIGVVLPGESSGAKVEAWQSVKIVDNKEEHDAAIKARSKIRSRITGVCIASPFGLLCPKDKEAELNAAITASRIDAQDFNATHTTCRVGVWVLKGQIVESDTDAARGIANEIKGLLAEMQSGIVARDEKAIRDAASKAQALGAMLEGQHAEKVTAAVKVARAAAREIVKTVAQRGNAALILVADTKLKELRAVEQSFLDLEAPLVVEGEQISPVAAGAVDDFEVAPAVVETVEPFGINMVPLADDIDASNAVDADVADFAEMAAGAPDAGPDFFEL